MVTSSKPDKIKPPIYHKFELRRGWRVLRQHVSLHVDLDKRSISGSASISLCVLNGSCSKIALNLRRCAVSSVHINSHPCAFEMASPLDDKQLLESVSSQHSRHRMKNVELSLSKRDDESRRCSELLISIPTKVTADFLADLHRLRPNLDSIDESDISGNSPPPCPIYELPLLHIDIEYAVLDPNAGAIFYGNRSDESGVRDPVYMLTDSRFGMARFWMPCVDSLNWCDRYLFDFDISVDPTLTAVASGELDEVVLLTNNTSPSASQREVCKTYKFRSEIPAHASEIVVAVGPFVVLPDPVLSSTVTHFCLPGHAHELVFTGPSLFSKAFAFCKDYFSSDPPTSSFKQLFLGSTGLHPEASIAGAGGVVVHSGDLLHTERCIDEAIIAREAVMSAVVRMYFGRFLRPRTSEDGWLITGLAAHVTALGLQLILGRNWFKFHIFELMEDLQKERSVDLSSADVDRLTGSMLESVRRRSHIILYMIERRIGGDVLKRASRDIIAEGKRSVSSCVNNIDKALVRQVILDEVGESTMTARLLPKRRELKDLYRDPGAEVVPNAAVSSGFDEAVQGVAVGPFLKRLRAICGTDVRSMVRLWASSPGIPRMQVGYQYNPRKHTIEVVVKQEPPTDAKNALNSPRPTLQFHGSIGLRVMEAEGAYDHTLEISDLIFAVEVPCHSRRKAGKGSGTEETNPNAVTQASPLSWIRFDPENEWCKEVTFKQHESSWASVLEGERDCIGQLEACRGLKGFTTEQSAKKLLSVLKDGQTYWKVRAEAAAVLASSTEGLRMLIDYFRSCYVDGDNEGGGHLRANNFSNIANYFVKRAMLKAIASARVKGSNSSLRHGSVPLEASQFLCFLLSGHDNADNDFDDDHYVIELLESVTNVAVECTEDEVHQNAGEGGSSTTVTIVKHLERFRSIERMIQRRSSLVSCALAKALARIEKANMIHEDKTKSGSVSMELRSGIRSPNLTIVRGLFEACRRENNMEDRLSSLLSLVSAYGGNIEVANWVMSFVDRTSENEDIITLRHGICNGYEKSENERIRVTGMCHDYCETPLFRYRLLDALCEAASSKEWYSSSSPLLLGIRSHTAASIGFCIRLLRIIVGDADPRVRASALQLARVAWGLGVPVCLMSQMEYIEAKHLITSGICPEAQEIVPMHSHGVGSSVEIVEVSQDGTAKVKSGRTKGVKNGKSKNKKSAANETSADLPPKLSKSLPVQDLINDPIEIEVPVLSTEAKVKSRPRRNIVVPLPVEPDVQPVLPPVPALETKRPVKPMLKSVPVSALKPPLQPLSKSTPPTPKLSSIPWSKSSKPVSKNQSPARVETLPPRPLVQDYKKANSQIVSNSTQDINPKVQKLAIPRSVAINTDGKPDSGSSLNRNLLRSVPPKPAKRDIKSVNFSWHPLDEEDSEYLKQAWEGSRVGKAPMNLNVNSKRMELGEVESTAPKVREQTSQPDKRKREVENVDIHHHYEDIAEVSESKVNGEEGDHKKKKKKKKRKREHDEDDEHRRKKKKKKKKRESDDHRTGSKSGHISDYGDGLESGSRDESKKIGKMKIKLPSRNTSQLTSAD